MTTVRSIEDACNESKFFERRNVGRARGRENLAVRERERKMERELCVSRLTIFTITRRKVRVGVLYPPVRAAVSRHLAATCSGFLVKNLALAGNVNVSPHVRASRDFIHETLQAPAGEYPPAMKYQSRVRRIFVERSLNR